MYFPLSIHSINTCYSPTVRQSCRALGTQWEQEGPILPEPSIVLRQCHGEFHMSTWLSPNAQWTLKHQPGHGRGAIS